MSYRDDLSAAAARTARLESALAEARAENERLRRDLAARTASEPSSPPEPADLPRADGVGRRFGWSDPMTYVPMIVIAIEKIREDWALADSGRIKCLLVLTSPIVLLMSVVMNVVFFPFLVLWGHHVRWR